MVIAIDGPAGSGKSTVAKDVARRLGYRYLDTGAMYRAVTLAALDTGIDLSDPKATAALAGLATTMTGDERLRSPLVDSRVSTVASHAEVRAALHEAQRRFLSEGDTVAEGRDVGAVVWPEAELKVWLDADQAERVRRRLAERGGSPRGRSPSATGATPATRSRPPDSQTLDTTGLTPEEVVEQHRAAGPGGGGEVSEPERRLGLLDARPDVGGLPPQPERALPCAPSASASTGVSTCRAPARPCSPRTTSPPWIPSCIAAITPRPIRYMAKIELLEMNRSPGHLPPPRRRVQRAPRRGRPSRRCASPAACSRTATFSGMFVEGTRQATEAIGPMQPGATMIALAEDAPVVPVVVQGTIYLKERPWHPVTVVVGEALVPPAGRGKGAVAAFTEEVRRELVALQRFAQSAIACRPPPRALPPGTVGLAG